MNRAPDSLPSVFLSAAQEILATSTHPTADWKLEDRGATTRLFIPKTNSDGFDVTVIADALEVTVYSEFLAHQHFTSDGDHRDTSLSAMGLVRDLLAPHMRVRVTEIGNTAHRASMEIFHDGQWQNEGTTGLLMITWFRRRKERIYINRRLPPREFRD